MSFEEVKTMDQSLQKVELDETVATPESPPKNKNRKAKTVKTTRKKQKIAKHIFSGRVYIQATYNNTMVTITDREGNVLAWSSAGQLGFRGPKKATPFAAGIIIKDVCEKVRDMGLREVSVFVKGVGAGREAALRALNVNNLNVLSIKDITPIPHNGCRPPKVRRV